MNKLKFLLSGCIVALIGISQALADVPAQQSPDMATLVSGMLKNIEQNCQYPKTISDYISLVSYSHKDKASMKLTDLEYIIDDPTTELMEHGGLMSSACKNAQYDNYKKYLKTKIDSLTIENDPDNLRRLIGAETALSNAIFNEQVQQSWKPLSADAKNEIDKYLKLIYQQSKDPLVKQLPMYALNYYTTEQPLYKLWLTDNSFVFDKKEWMYKRQSQIFQDVYDEYSLNKFEQINRKDSYVSVFIGVEYKSYFDQMLELMKSLNNGNNVKLEELLSKYTDLYNNYEKISTDYNKKYGVDYGFSQVVGKEEVAGIISVIYANLRNLDKSKQWLLKSDLIDQQQGTNLCKTNHLVGEPSLDAFLLAYDSNWYQQHLNLDFCKEQKSTQDIVAKFSGYDKLIARLDKNCPDLGFRSALSYARIQQMKLIKSNLNDYAFYDLINDNLENEHISDQCKAAFNEDNKEILNFYVKNMPKTAYMYDDAIKKLNEYKTLK